METFHLYHLAKVYPRSPRPRDRGAEITTDGSAHAQHGGIRASGIQMVFASRMTQEFITPGHVQELEHWVGRACLEAICQFEIADELLHPVEDSVWA
ncbi:hypothetical protein FRC07_010587 [Ceratobasidium sp. 392]|nr:hypothetical protein FRC07_010587 [Ceratobasidium sp. 392]